MDEKIHYRGIDGVELTYRRWTPTQSERLAPILLLHGAASNSTRWWYFIEHSQLTRQHLMLRPDLRGHGDSIWRGYAKMEQWCQDLDALLMQEHQTKVFVVGHCLGANLALYFASRYPALCAGLVLVEPIDYGSVAGILAKIKTCLPLFRIGMWITRLLNRLGLYRRHLQKLNLRDLDRPVLEASSIERDQVLAKHGSPWHDIQILPVIQYLGNFVELFRPLPVTSIHCPCLVIQSSGQKITDPQKTKIALRKISNAEFTEVESEHWIPVTQPDLLCRLIDNWIQKKQD